MTDLSLPRNFYYLSLIKCNDLWYIHGLWPNFSDGYPTYCKNVKFDKIKDKILLSDLERYWFSPTKKPDVELWKHEYEKHGSCMFIPISEDGYFNKALELFYIIIDAGLLDKLPKDINNYKFIFTTSFQLIKN